MKSMSTSQRESASYDHFQGHDKKYDLSLASTNLSSYRDDPVAGQISVAQRRDVPTNNQTFKYLSRCCQDPTAALVL